MSKKSEDIVITNALRTPIGKYKGSLLKHQAHDLGSIVIKNLLLESNIASEDVDEVIMGQVLTGNTGQNPARQASIKAGIPKSKTAYLINQVCGSGLRSIASAYQSLRANDSNIIVAGGQESMSNCDKDLMLKDGLIDVYNKYHMGFTAENVADKWNISRHDQDKFALNSQHKTQKALENNKFREEMITELKEKDEHPRSDVTLESLSSLKTVFKEKGTVTPGNSSGINDGAAGVIMMKRNEAEKRNLSVLAKITSWATCGVDPSLMGSGPIPSSIKALGLAKWDVGDLDLIESNEAFAAQSLAVIKELKLPYEKVNVNGGAIALGHPIGASGCRIIVTLIHEMIKRDAKKGLGTLCIGGGMGIAMCLERD